LTSACGDTSWIESVTLEQMRPEDLAAVLDIERSSFPSAWSAESYLRELRNPHSYYFTARLGSELVGYAGMWIVAEEAHISTIAVHPQRRRRGVGERLMSHLMSVAKERQATRMTLEVREGNLAAQALYLKLGFRSAALVPRYYGDTGESALVMYRSLVGVVEPGRLLE